VQTSEVIIADLVQTPFLPLERAPYHRPVTQAAVSRRRATHRALLTKLSFPNRSAHAPPALEIGVADRFKQR